jgi:O-antigen/teichoic acid export membrane protein
MRKKFALNLLFLLAANLLVKPFWIFGIDRVVQNKVGPAEYGTYFAVFNFSFIIGIVLDFGLNNFNNRAVSRNKNRLGEYLYNIMWLKVGLAFIYFVLTFLFAWASGLDAHQLNLLAYLAINQILLSFVLYFRSNVAALQWFKLDAFLSVLDRVLTIVFCLILLYVSPFNEQFNLLYFIYAQTAALLLTAIVSFLILVGQSTTTHRRWSWRYTQKILLRSAPFALLALFMGIYYRIDAVMIERLLPDGKVQAGIYAASFRMLDAVNMFGYLFATLLLPMFSKMLREKADINSLVKFSSELMFAGSTTVAVACFFFQEPIMHLLYHNTNPYWCKIFGWLMLNFIPMSSVYVFGTLLTASGQLRTLNWIAVSGALLNILLNFWLINSFAAFGAVIATLVTQSLVAIIHVAVAYRQFSLQSSWIDTLKLIVFAAAIVVLFAIVAHLISIWWLGLMLGILGSGAMLLALHIFRYQDFMALLKVRATS